MEKKTLSNALGFESRSFYHRDIIDRGDKPAWNLSPRARVIWRDRLSLSNVVRVDKDRKITHRLSLSLSPSLQTDVATYRAAYGLSPLSISLCFRLPVDCSNHWATQASDICDIRVLNCLRGHLSAAYPIW